MTTSPTRRRSIRRTTRLLVLAAMPCAAVALSMGAAGNAAAGSTRPSGIPDGESDALAIASLFAGAGWTVGPTVIGSDDAALDQFALAPGSEQIASPQNDIVSFESGRTAPLDDATVAALTSPGGLLFDIDPARGVYGPSIELPLDDFRSGMLVTFVRTSGAFVPPTTPGNSYVVAVEYADARYPSPPSGNFVGIPKAHRLEVRPEGHALVYVQFTGTEFGIFQSSTVVADTCARQAPLTGPCGFLFLTALAGTETEGITAVGAEVYEQQGEFAIADRIGEWPGQMIPTDTVQPGTVGIVEQAQEPAATTTIAAEPQPSPAASPTPESAEVSVTAVQAPAVSPPVESAEPVVVAAPEVQAAEQPAAAGGQSTSNSNDDGLPILPISAVIAGLAVTALGVGVIRKAKPAQAQQVNQAPANESVLRFTRDTTDQAVDGRTVVTPSPSETDIAWGVLLERNAEADKRVSQAAATVTKTVLPSLVDFATIAGDYAAPYRRAVTGMVMMREHESEVDVQLARAKIADMVVAVANLALLVKNLGKLAIHGVQWMRRPPTQLATGIIDPPLNAGIGTFTGPQPTKFAPKPDWFKPEAKFASNWSEPSLGVAGEDALFWQMERMAGEVGENLLGVINREGGIEAAVDFLRLAVVRKRGFVILDAADVIKLERIVIQARNASRDQPYSYRLDDLRWLFTRNTPEGRQQLADAISGLEVAGSFEANGLTKILSANDATLVDGLFTKPGLADAIADATGSAVVDVGTGSFGSVFGLPGAAAVPATTRFGAVLDLPPLDPNATGSFPAVLDLPVGSFPAVLDAIPGTNAFRGLESIPGTNAFRVLEDGFGAVAVPPTVGPGRLLDPVLDSIPGTSAGTPDTLAPGRFFPWTAGRVDPSKTTAFGDVLVDGGSTGVFPDRIFLDPTDTVPPGTMSFGQASEFASSLLAADRSGVVAGPGAIDVIAALPPQTPVVAFGPGLAPVVGGTNAGAFVAGDLLQPGIQLIGIFGQGYDAITGAPLTTLYDIATRGGGMTDAGSPVWIGEMRPAEITFVPTGNLPPGTHVVLTETGFVVVDPTQPMRATPDAPVPSGLAAGSLTIGAPLRAFPLSSATPAGAWLDPQWIADQQRALGESAEGLAGIKDVKSVLENLVDPSWMQHDFCVLGVDLEGGAVPAQLAWITLSAGTSPFEFITRATYFFIGGGMLESYVRTYAPDYVLMKDLVFDAVDVLTAIEKALPATISVLEVSRNAIAGLAADVAAFGAQHPDWVAGNHAAFAAKLARDAQTIAHADQSLASLRHLQSLVGQLIPWVRSLVIAPDGSDIPAYMLAWPTSLLRISSTLLMLSDAFGRVCLLAPAPALEVGPAAAMALPGAAPAVAAEGDDDDTSWMKQHDKRPADGSYLERTGDEPPDPDEEEARKASDAFSRELNRRDPAPRDD